jgi:hypothetical protein
LMAQSAEIRPDTTTIAFDCERETHKSLCGLFGTKLQPGERSASRLLNYEA